MRDKGPGIGVVTVLHCMRLCGAEVVRLAVEAHDNCEYSALENAITVGREFMARKRNCCLFLSPVSSSFSSSFCISSTSSCESSSKTEVTPRQYCSFVCSYAMHDELVAVCSTCKEG
ncbi:uncharacterized protein [Physcomitrium patens]|uniref:uncharacterized protein isoform X2 n=1 Tax=Physcomitrium patens TaxID=3218 RepID=UPI003CCD2FE1